MFDRLEMGILYTCKDLYFEEVVPSVNLRDYSRSLSDSRTQLTSN